MNIAFEHSCFFRLIILKFIQWIIFITFKLFHTAALMVNTQQHFKNLNISKTSTFQKTFQGTHQHFRKINSISENSTFQRAMFRFFKYFMFLILGFPSPQFNALWAWIKQLKSRCFMLRQTRENRTKKGNKWSSCWVLTSARGWAATFTHLRLPPWLARLQLITLVHKMFVQQIIQTAQTLQRNTKMYFLFCQKTFENLWDAKIFEAVMLGKISLS